MSDDIAPDPPRRRARSKSPERPYSLSPTTLAVAQAINDLLVEPLALLPVKADDAIRPLRIGVGSEIAARLKPDARPADLSKALRRYTLSRTYLWTLAQPGSWRYGLDGTPVLPVTDRDREWAKFTLENMRKRSADRKAAGKGSVPAGGEMTSEGFTTDSRPT